MILMSAIQIFALVVIILGTIFGISSLWANSKGAPWVPTRIKKAKKMLELADIQPDDLVYDLGCGDGRILILVARKYNAKAVGIEIDLIRYLWCQFLITILGLRKKVTVIRGDIFKQNFEDADIIFCYLLQSTNNRLESKLLRELSPSTKIISNTFTFKKLELLSDETFKDYYLYQIPENIT